MSIFKKFQILQYGSFYVPSQSIGTFPIEMNGKLEGDLKYICYNSYFPQIFNMSLVIFFCTFYMQTWKSTILFLIGVYSQNIEVHQILIRIWSITKVDWHSGFIQK